MDVEFGGVDDDVGEPADRRHPPAFLANSLGDGAILPERMRAARFAEAAHQSFVARLDEYQRGGVLAAQLAKNSGQLLDLLAFARVDQQSRAFDFAAFVIKFAESGNQRDGKIIDAVKAEVFEGI